jgi:hypothetical protein
MARWLTDVGIELLMRRFEARSGFLFLLDIRPMTSREPVVGSLMIDTAREHADTFSDVFIVPPLQINPVYLTTLHAAAALISAFGARVEVANDVQHVLRDAQIRLAAG